jgi:hypothetical protein
MTPAVLLLSVLLSQATSPQQPSNQEAKSKAQALLKQGSALFEQGDYQAALDKFDQAYAIFPSPKLQFNIAQANRDLGRPVEALKAYEAFLSKAPDASPDALGDARRSVADLRSRLGQLNVDCSPTESDVAVDGKSVGRAPLQEPIWAVPGYHQVTIQHQQFLPAIENVDVLAGKVQTLTVRLRSSLPPPRPSLGLAPTEPEPGVHLQVASQTDEGNVRHPRYRTYFWTGVGTTGALVIGAVVAGLAANSKFNELHDSCGRTTAGCTESQIGTAKSRVAVTNVLWALAGAAAVTTGIVLYVDNHETGATLSWMF